MGRSAKAPLIHAILSPPPICSFQFTFLPIVAVPSISTSD